MSIFGIVRRIYEAITRIWAFVENLNARNHWLFRGVSLWVILRLAIGIANTLITKIYAVVSTVQTSLNQASNMGGAIGTLDALRFVNAVFPLQEAFALVTALVLIKGSFLALNGVRYLYKQIPFKAS